MENNLKEMEFVKKNINMTWGNGYDLDETLIREINENDNEDYEGYYVQLKKELEEEYKYFSIYKIKKTEFKNFIKKEINFRLLNMPFTIDNQLLKYCKDKRFKTLDKISINKLSKKMWKYEKYNVFKINYDNIFTNLHYVYCVNSNLRSNIHQII